MNRSETRELAFKLLYQIEIQKEINNEDLALFFENNDVQSKKAQEYIEDVVNGINKEAKAIMDTISTEPLTNVFAIPKDTANTIKPTASSNATIGSNSLVKGPFALNCLTTMRVAAGAVAVAMAPNVRSCGTDNLSGIIKCTTTNARSTNKVATSA